MGKVWVCEAVSPAQIMSKRKRCCSKKVLQGTRLFIRLFSLTMPPRQQTAYQRATHRSVSMHMMIASSLGGASRLALRSVQLRCRSTKAAQTGESG